MVCKGDPIKQAGERQNYLPAPWGPSGGACGGGATVPEAAGGPRACALFCRREHEQAQVTPGPLPYSDYGFLNKSLAVSLAK